MFAAGGVAAQPCALGAVFVADATPPACLHAFPATNLNRYPRPSNAFRTFTTYARGFCTYSVPGGHLVFGDDAAILAALGAPQAQVATGAQYDTAAQQWVWPATHTALPPGLPASDDDALVVFDVTSGQYRVVNSSAYGKIDIVCQTRAAVRCLAPYVFYDGNGTVPPRCVALVSDAPAHHAAAAQQCLAPPAASKHRDHLLTLRNHGGLLGQVLLPAAAAAGNVFAFWTSATVTQWAPQPAAAWHDGTAFDIATLDNYGAAASSGDAPAAFGVAFNVSSGALAIVPRNATLPYVCQRDLRLVARRLTGSTDVTQGVLQYYVDFGAGALRDVCRANFQSAAAWVACRDLGYDSGLVLETYYVRNEITERAVVGVPCGNRDAATVEQCGPYAAAARCSLPLDLGVACTMADAPLAWSAAITTVSQAKSQSDQGPETTPVPPPVTAAPATVHIVWIALVTAALVRLCTILLAYV